MICFSMDIFYVFCAIGSFRNIGNIASHGLQIPISIGVIAKPRLYRTPDHRLLESLIKSLSVSSRYDIYILTKN